MFENEKVMNILDKRILSKKETFPLEKKTVGNSNHHSEYPWEDHWDYNHP